MKLIFLPISTCLPLKILQQWCKIFWNSFVAWRFSVILNEAFSPEHLLNCFLLAWLLVFSQSCPLTTLLRPVRNRKECKSKWIMVAGGWDDQEGYKKRRIVFQRAWANWKARGRVRRKGPQEGQKWGTAASSVIHSWCNEECASPPWIKNPKVASGHWCAVGNWLAVTILATWLANTPVDLFCWLLDLQAIILTTNQAKGAIFFLTQMGKDCYLLRAILYSLVIWMRWFLQLFVLVESDSVLSKPPVHLLEVKSFILWDIRGLSSMKGWMFSPKD